MEGKSLDPGDVAIDSSSNKVYVRTESGAWHLASGGPSASGPYSWSILPEDEGPPKTSQIAAITPGVLPTRCLLSQALVFGYKEIDLNKLCSHCLLAALVDGDNHQGMLRGAISLALPCTGRGPSLVG